MKRPPLFNWMFVIVEPLFCILCGLGFVAFPQLLLPSFIGPNPKLQPAINDPVVHFVCGLCGACMFAFGSALHFAAQSDNEKFLRSVLALLMVGDALAIFVPVRFAMQWGADPVAFVFNVGVSTVYACARLWYLSRNRILSDDADKRQ